MISKLTADSAFNFVLTTPVCIVMGGKPNDHRALESVIHECALNIQASTPASKWNPGDKKTWGIKRSAHAGQVAPAMGGVPAAEITCFSYREHNKCDRDGKDGKTCPFKHEGRSGNKCTNKDYVKTGMCSNFRDWAGISDSSQASSRGCDRTRIRRAASTVRSASRSSAVEHHRGEPRRSGHCIHERRRMGPRNGVERT